MVAQRHTLITAEQLGAELQAARKARKLTQAALASQIGLSQSRVSYLELNARELSVEQLLAWCAVIGLELSMCSRSTAVPDNAVDW